MTKYENFITSLLLSIPFLLGLLYIAGFHNIFCICKDRLQVQQEKLLSKIDKVNSVLKKSVESQNDKDLKFLSLLINNISQIKELKDQIEKK